MAIDETRRQGERVALAQAHQIDAVDDRLQQLGEHAVTLATVSEGQAGELAELERQLAALRAQAGLDAPTEEELAAAQSHAAIQVTEAEERDIRARLPDLSAPLAVPSGEAGWAEYMREVEGYIDAHGIDMDRDPFERLLKPHQIAHIHRRFQADFGETPWDHWDGVAVAAAVLVGTLVDYFIVATPLGGEFKGIKQRGSPVTQWLREQSEAIAPGSKYEGTRNTVQQWLRDLSQQAEDWAKVSYDLSCNSKAAGISVDGLRPKMHRLMSLGHDPVLGLVFGIIDILRGTCTLVDANGAVRVILRQDCGADPLEALVKVVVHLFSDLFTAQGVPVPFMSVLQTLNFDSGLSLKQGGDTVSVTNVVRFMYANGYDMRHFATMTLSPGVAELMIRLFHAIRGLQVEGQAGVNGIGGRMKLAKMLTLTHGLLASTNILKTALYSWNPTALNFAQFMALGKQLFSLLSLSEERDQLIGEQLAAGWEKLLVEPNA